MSSVEISWTDTLCNIRPVWYLEVISSKICSYSRLCLKRGDILLVATCSACRCVDSRNLQQQQQQQQRQHTEIKYQTYQLSLVHYRCTASVWSKKKKSQEIKIIKEVYFNCEITPSTLMIDMNPALIYEHSDFAWLCFVTCVQRARLYAALLQR